MRSLFLLALSALFLVQSIRAEKPASPIYELRTYYANEGKLDALHSRFRDHTIALFEKSGMTNVIYLTPTENEDNSLTYLLSFDSIEHKEASWKAFLGNPDWKVAYKASIADGKLVKKIDSTLLHTTDFSPSSLAPAANENPRLIELRTYKTLEGRLSNLDARFRDHTCALFEKHGITNLIYLHPAEGNEGHGSTLTYLIAHKDQESRAASFKAFGSDPAWKVAKEASTADGAILVQQGITSRFFTATDYSTVK